MGGRCYNCNQPGHLAVSKFLYALGWRHKRLSSNVSCHSVIALFLLVEDLVLPVEDMAVDSVRHSLVTHVLQLATSAVVPTTLPVTVKLKQWNAMLVASLWVFIGHQFWKSEFTSNTLCRGISPVIAPLPTVGRWALLVRSATSVHRPVTSLESAQMARRQPSRLLMPLFPMGQQRPPQRLYPLRQQLQQRLLRKNGIFSFG